MTRRGDLLPQQGIFVTTSTFSQGAREFVQRIAQRSVLVDGVELARLMLRHEVGVRTRTVYDLKRIDEDYFTERSGALAGTR
jgi:restriction system protein